MLVTLLQHKIKSKSKITVSSEFDTRALGTIPAIGFGLSLTFWKFLHFQLCGSADAILIPHSLLLMLCSNMNWVAKSGKQLLANYSQKKKSIQKLLLLLEHLQNLFLPFGPIKPAIKFICILVPTEKYEHFPGKSFYFSKLIGQGNNLGQCLQPNIIHFSSEFQPLNLMISG